MSTAQAVTTLGEMRDSYAAGNQRSGAQIALAIGAELGFDARRGYACQTRTCCLSSRFTSLARSICTM